ncbi:TOMM precursor leader peptide-binding protein [Actinokineospora sp.]|uniref:TOMM precursor leader peptide-binding protein n=1 Tax=Actinokineospora sp. TaxID=1872133 RepID=UPI004037F87C
MQLQHELRLIGVPRQTVSAVRRYFAERIGADQAAPVPDVGLLGLTDLLGAGPAERPPVPVFPIRLYGNVAILGPASGPSDPPGAPCPRCLDRRWQVIRPVEERHALESGGTAVAAGPVPQLTAFALEAMWRIYLAVRAEPAPAGRGLVHALVLDTLRVSRHALVADSDCPVCARPVADTPEAAVIEVRPRAKRAVDDYREIGARDLAVPVNPYANPVCGALGSVPMRVHQDTATAPVSGRFRVRSKYGLHDMGWGGHAGNYRDSEVIGVLEGLERFAGQRPRGRRVEVFDAMDNLAEPVLDPTGWATYPAESYRSLSAFYEPFRSDSVIPWVWGFSLRDQRPLLVAEQVAYFLDHRPELKKFVQESSNGCAGGSSTEEALLHGMLELVERDAFLLAWYGKAKLAELDPATCRDRRVHFMIDRVGLHGYDIRLFDMRIDLPVPAVLAVAVRRDGGPGTLCLSAGASFDPDDAVRAAVCEVASYVPSLPHRVERHTERLRAMSEDYVRLAELEDHQLLYGLPEMARHADYLFEDPPLVGMDELYRSWLAERPATLDLADDVRHLVRLIAGTGSDVIAIDQTCPEQRLAGAHTVGVIAPGLVPIDFGWLRQRAPHHPRLHAFLDGGLGQGGAPGHPATPTGRNPHPHPFP